MVIFEDDDDEYLGWLDRHPHGFVINSTRPASASYLVLHAAQCTTIRGRPTRGTYWTRDYVKVCAETTDALQAWARREFGSAAKACERCAPAAG
ncbi:MAG TPA: hypothetical protein VFC53_05780 [Dehalococcoidia bacterium]|nr:hypothetical protein [Dehalococcoidia bacterium]